MHLTLVWNETQLRIAEQCVRTDTLAAQVRNASWGVCVPTRSEGRRANETLRAVYFDV